MTIPTEEQIKSSWIGSSKVKVSICCTTYNHEDYIEETLKGFLVQKTLFPFEVIVHDDASTDNTLSILQKFKKLYPGLINLIVQEENQYSKGKNKYFACLTTITNYNNYPQKTSLISFN